MPMKKVKCNYFFILLIYWVVSLWAERNICIWFDRASNNKNTVAFKKIKGQKIVSEREDDITVSKIVLSCIKLSFQNNSGETHRNKKIYSSILVWKPFYTFFNNRKLITYIEWTKKTKYLMIYTKTCIIKGSEVWNINPIVEYWI